MAPTKDNFNCSRKIKKSIQKIKIQDIGSYTNWTDLVVSRRI